ncbi:MAG: ribosome biogenesis GTPase Der [Bacteroidetes bacterium]|nr:ribosome biogenesis GTPase Der [Bacteroidota bacterium]
MANIVAIVGRPNVGKSTLFNRLTESRTAIVDEQAGVTRDRHYGRVEWNGKEFIVIDTGGYVPTSNDVFDVAIKRQVKIAIEECNIIIFLVDVIDGITDLDQGVADLLRKSNKKIFLVANKVDNYERQFDASEFYNFGLGEVLQISAISGSGTGELLDLIAADITEEKPEDTSGLPKIAVVGKPNVGKSSIVNAFMNQERNIVTPMAGTTRDTIHTRYKAFGHDFILIDTAGLRKKSRVDEDIEFYSTLRTLNAIENSDVCLLMIDAEKGIEAQDITIFHIIEKAKKGVVIVVNKWDLVEKDSNTINAFTIKIQEAIRPFSDVPIIYTSVPDKQRILKALETALEVNEKRTSTIKTSKLNDVLGAIIDRFPPPTLKGKMVKIKYITQLPTKTPAFAFFCNHPKYIQENYKRFLEKQIREQFDFSGVPITLFFREK